MENARNKRLYERVKIDSERIYDLSEGGLYIKTKEPKRLGSLVGLELKLFDDEPPFMVKGQVIRIIYEKGSRKNFPPGMAVQFEPLPLQYREKIRTYIQNKKTGRI
jgi:Tfp pilus assembly protein PilZ